MNKEKALNQGVGLPSSESSYGMKSVVSGSTNFPALAAGGTSGSGHIVHAMSSDSSSSNHHISQMPDDPPQMFDSSLDIDQATSVFQVGESSSSVAVSSSSPTSASVAAGFDSLSVVSEKPEMFTSGTEKPSLADFKIPMSAAQTLELALSKQKEEKSQSADLLTERENQYIAELEKTAQKVENERISLIAQVTKLQRDRNALAAENSELKLLLQTRKEQANSKDSFSYFLEINWRG